MKPTRLDELLMYYRMTRRLGHTSFAIEGIHFDREAAILFTTNGQAGHAFEETIRRREIPDELINRSQMKIGKVRFATIGFLNNLQESMRGRIVESMPPIIVDHFALQVLIDEDREAKEKKS